VVEQPRVAVLVGRPVVGDRVGVAAVVAELGEELVQRLGVAQLVLGERAHRHVLLEEGHLWGRKQVAIPVSAVASIEDGIRLNITKRQIEDLPPLGQSR